MSETKILICDDEDDLREMVIEYLGERGYQITGVPDADELRNVFESISPALIILDVRMPGESGITALTKLRAQSNVPVIMLTAAAEIIDRVVGLELGADDYMTKPVDLRELEARIRSVLRRSDDRQCQIESRLPSNKDPRVQIGECLLNIETARLFGPRGEEISITAMELALLTTMVSHRGRILSRDQLLDLAHAKGWEPFDRSIDLRISRLRGKIEKNPRKPEVIQTVRGIGYRLV